MLPSSSGLVRLLTILLQIGCFFGAVAAFSFGEKLGRKRSIAVGAALMMVGAALQASAFTRGHLIAGRIVSGLGMGLINSTAPVLQSEVSPKASRGRCESRGSGGCHLAQLTRGTCADVCAQLSTLNLGIFLAYWLDYVSPSARGRPTARRIVDEYLSRPPC